ncbi:MAG: alpha/beta fold hydrolase [Candidimonas sp.]|nr:MAG: alpha/beta fold hydrolase [Candidimonas sp.]TAM24423.1 MAG: alpha/beta fold hydrolase [Candidimonas sp.]TAM76015.1 MAG: alpha/beta fold hydrolase [Candidimonas sp.]
MPASPPTTKTFVLVHGAWHGGWCWAPVAQVLRAFGHQVYTPTLTGLGERSHLLGANITINTFVRDVENVLVWENLHEVILVGHSFGGLAITGVADRVPQRLQQLVYLDAFILGGGVSTFDTLPSATVAKMREAAHEFGQGLALPAPKPKGFGLSEDAHIDFVAKRLTPQPLATYETALQLNHPIGNRLPCAYWHCTAPSYAPLEGSRQWAKAQADWVWTELATGHDAMVSAPELVVKHLLEL